MSILREFLHEQKLKLSLKPHTWYPNAKIKYVTEFQNGFATALISNSDSDYHDDPSTVMVINSSFAPVLKTQYFCKGNAEWLNGHIVAVNTNYSSPENVVFLDSELKEVPDKSFAAIETHHDYFIVSKAKFSKDSHFGYFLIRGILDQNLKEILPIIYNSLSPISPTRFFCKIDNENPIIFDAATCKKFDLKNVYKLYKPLQNGYCKFQSTDERHLYGYFDYDFNIAIEPKYSFLGDFDKNGFAPFSRYNVIGVVNQKGEEFLR